LTVLPVDIEAEALRLEGLQPLSNLPESALRQGLAGWNTQFVLVLRLGQELVGIIGVGYNQETISHRTEMLSQWGLMGGQLALILKNYELETNFERSQRQLQHAYRRVIDTQADERRHLATQLHDEILGQLTLLSLTLRNSQKQLATNPERVRGWLEMTVQETQAINRRLREITQGLHPSVLCDLGLISALQAYLDTLSQQAAVFPTNPVITLTAQGFAERLPDPKLEADVYYLIRQAVDNALSHAHADQILIHLRWHETAVTMTIKDTGQGMKDDPETLTGQNGHLGLLSIKERALAWRGQVDFYTAPNQGTTIYARLPIAQPSCAPTHLQAFTHYLRTTTFEPALLEAKAE
jgi:signal transduction histidine kinase